MIAKHLPGPPMDLANMSEQGFYGVIANQRKRLGASRRTCG